MPTNRIFPKKGVDDKKDDYYGNANYKNPSPDPAEKGVKSLNLELSFEEGLKLSMALQTCLQQVSRYSRQNKEGKAMGIMLSIKTDNSSITVFEKQGRI